MVERVMILDAVLGDRRCWWLSPECDKRALLRRHAADRTAARGLPAHRVRSGPRARPSAASPTSCPSASRRTTPSRFVFLYLVNRRIPVDFRQFLIRHADLFRFLHHVDGSAARAAPLQEGRRALQGGAPRRALDAAESERQQVAGDVLSRTPGAGRTPRRSVRSLHRAGVPEAGHAEDPGPLSGVATSRATGCSGSRPRPACATTGRTAVRPSRFSC